jgi:hypothetical protein
MSYLGSHGNTVVCTIHIEGLIQESGRETGHQCMLQAFKQNGDTRKDSDKSVAGALHRRCHLETQSLPALALLTHDAPQIQ